MVADLFTFDDDNLPTPRDLPDGWRIEQQGRATEGILLAYTAPRSVTPMGGRLTVYVEEGVLPPERLLYHARGRHIGLRAMARGYYVGVSVERLEICAAKASATKATREHYAYRLLDLLTWIPGPAGDGWRRMREDVGKRPAAEVFAELQASLPPVDIEAFLRAHKSGACERSGQ